jgi:hypothetical protein
MIFLPFWRLSRKAKEYLILCGLCGSAVKKVNSDKHQ